MSRLFEPVTEERGTQHADARVAAGEVVELEQERMEQHAEGQRQDAEENAHVAHREHRHGDGRDDRRGARQQEDRFETLDAELARQHSRTIGADRHEERVAEGEQTGIAEQQVEAEQRDGVGEGRQDQRDVVGLRDAREREQYDQHCDDEREPHDVSPVRRCARVAHSTTLPNRPAGRTTSTTITTR